ncbi:MerR family transcriptional regulator [Pandoraea sp.]|uniref:MerR family transcriptional regulator n=1 Tax=Pandoraea sp. TaxID=1883445 RepID=UPI0012035ACB|nr:MerR family transcriptional regulator [Pandoraea sp.]TAL54562.1 MAG: MerR family transcriptional regulator [Pandoraea sp.]TAM15738.1 MAG: MerR family transcriptional regulator [Pandoraea sp.]
MNRPKRQPAARTDVPPGASSATTFRSGTVARLARMPVATLRIWEQRHRAVQPATAPSGHRLYAPADVERVILLRQLTDQGHGIGTIAGLSTKQLQELINQPGSLQGTARPAAAMRMVVVGPALAARLQRPAVSQGLAKPARVVAAFDSLAQAAQAAQGSADLLIWHAPALHDDVPAELQAARRAWGMPRVAVIYRFAGRAATQAFAQAGVVAVREAAGDEALGAWLASMQTPSAASAAQARAPIEPHVAMPPRRYDDATLTAIAGLPPTLACECPRHVAELLMQVSSFEAYSASCVNRNDADAELHAYLQQVAGAARVLFESAMESLARHEGLQLR